MNRRELLTGAAVLAGIGQANAFGIGKEGARGGFGHAGAVLGSPRGITPVSLPTTNLVAVYSVVKVNGWAGNCLRVQRASDNAQMDIGFVGSVVDKATADTFAGGSALTIATWYDQSGNGYDSAQGTTANQPSFTSLNEWRGIRPVTFDSFPGTTPKNLRTPTNITGLNRNAFTFYGMISPRGSSQPTSYFEGYSDTGFATSVAQFANPGASNGVNFGSLVTAQVYPRSMLQTMAVSSPGSGVKMRFDGSETALATGAISSASIVAMQFGRLAVNTTFNACDDRFLMAVYAQGDSSATMLANEAALNSAFQPICATNNAWTKQLLEDGTSLEIGWHDTLLQNQSWQGDFARWGGGLADWDYINMAVGGNTLATQYANRSRLISKINLARSKIIVVVPAPSNDIANTTYTSVADAQTGNVNSANNLYNNFFLPYVAAMKAAGSTGQLAVTVIPRGGWDQTTNWKESARLYYDNLIVTGAGTNGYVVADVASITELNTPPFSATYWFADNIHLINSGYLLMENVKKPLILAF